jgi:hypothetical protein
LTDNWFLFIHSRLPFLPSWFRLIGNWFLLIHSRPWLLRTTGQTYSEQQAQHQYAWLWELHDDASPSESDYRRNPGAQQQHIDTTIP